ncbi:MAG: hypothetical protein ACSHX9_10165 [Luteolibacter sp.]
MSEKDRPENKRKGGNSIEPSLLLSCIAMKGLENLRPLRRRFYCKKRVFEISEKSAYTFINAPEKHWSRHVRDAEQSQYDHMHGPQLYRRRSGQQNAQHDQVMIKTSDTLLGYHVEVPPSAVVLLQNGHLSFLHKVLLVAPIADMQVVLSTLKMPKIAEGVN